MDCLFISVSVVYIHNEFAHIKWINSRLLFFVFAVARMELNSPLFHWICAAPSVNHLHNIWFCSHVNTYLCCHFCFWIACARIFFYSIGCECKCNFFKLVFFSRGPLHPPEKSNKLPRTYSSEKPMTKSVADGFFRVRADRDNTFIRI